MNWVEKASHQIRHHKRFVIEIEGVEAINVRCWKYTSGNPWLIEILGWTIENYSFNWYKRFNKDKVLKEVEKQIQQINAVKLVVFNRIWEMPYD